MALRHRVEYLRTEHKKLLQLADRIETALALASHKEFPDHEKSLAELRALEHGFSGILEHCHAEDRIVESTFHQYLNPKERLRIEEEHGKIVRALSEFREELRFSTVDRMTAMILPGMDVVNQLRAHVAHETGLLDRIVRSVVSDRKPRVKKKASHRRPASQRARVRKTGLRSKQETSHLPSYRTRLNRTPEL
jgi:hypothetical protein